VDLDLNRGSHRLATATAVATLLLTLAACGNSNDTRSATAGLPDVVRQLSANEWALDFSASSIPADGRITITFSEAHVLSGAAPCNLYKGTYSVDEFDIRIHTIIQTARSCSGQSGAAERAYFRALGQVRHVEPSNRDRLELTGASNTKLSYRVSKPLPPEAAQKDDNSHGVA
jgi:heat shock protein HslJ